MEERDSVGNVKGDPYIPGPKTRAYHGDSHAAPEAPPAKAKVEVPESLPDSAKAQAGEAAAQGEIGKAE